MRNNLFHKSPYYISAFLICATGLLILYPVFNLPLWGDDFLTIWRWLSIVGGPNPRPEWNYLTYFLTTYGPQDTITGILYKLFGFNATYYHLTSLIFRLGMALSVTLPVYYLTKSRLAATFSAIFLAVSVIGFDTTNWVFNMTSYVSLTWFNLFLYSWLKTHHQFKSRWLILCLLFFYLTFIWSPIRMTGLVPFVIILEICYLLIYHQRQNFRQSLIRLGLILTVFLFIRVTGHSVGWTNDITSRFQSGTTEITTNLIKGQWGILLYPLRMFGGMIYPDNILPTFPSILRRLDLIKTLIIPSVAVAMTIAWWIRRHSDQLPRSFMVTYLIGCLASSLLTLLAFTYRQISFVDITNLFLLQISLLTISLIIILGFYLSHQRNLLIGLMIGLGWSIASFLPAWYWVPVNIMPTYYRYLIGSGVGIAIILGVTIGLGRSTIGRFNIALLISLLLILQMIGTRSYLNQMLSYHSKQLSDKIWSQMPPIPDINQHNLVYFEGENNHIVFEVLVFNYDYRQALYHQLWDETKIPTVMGNLEDVKKAVDDGQILRTYGRPQIPVPITRVYGYRLVGNDQIVDITSEIRKKIQP